MVLKIFIFFILSFPLFAQDHDDCDHNKDGVIKCLPTGHDDEKNFAKKYLEWWAASDYQVKNAFCRKPGKPSIEQMKNYINRNKLKDVVTKKVFGMDIIDEDPHMVDLLERLTKFNPPFSIDDKEDKKNQKEYSIPDTCKKVLCAAESLFGKESATKMLYALDKYEINLSHLTDVNLSNWKSEEMDIILESVDDLPAHLIPFEKNKSLKHYKRGYGPSSSTIANAVITVFSVWDNLPSNEEKIATFIHEIGHNIGFRLKQDESNRWLDFSGWVEKEGEWVSTKKDQLVSKYGATNPSEDFAETFTAFRYNPEQLKKLSPIKYDYMKKYVYLGLEYDSEINCNDRKTNIVKLKESINISSAPTPQKYGKCKSEISSILRNIEVSLKECIKKSKLSNELDKKIKGKDPVEMNTIINAISFEEINGDDITDEEELIAYKRIIGDIYGSIANNYYNFEEDNCSVPQKYGYQDLKDFFNYTFNEDYALYSINDEVNDLVKNVCLKNKGSSTLKCENVMESMLTHLPKRLTKQTNLKEDKKQRKDETGNAFRCPF